MKFKPGDRIYYYESPHWKGVIVKADYKNIACCYTIKWDKEIPCFDDGYQFPSDYRWHKDAIEKTYRLIEDETEQTLSQIMYG